jgi:hypothetical protein
MAGLVPATHAVMPGSYILPCGPTEATDLTIRASARSAASERSFDPPNRVGGRVEPGHDGPDQADGA